MEVDGRHQQAGVPGKPLREEEVSGVAVDLVHRRMTESVEGVPLVESGLPLPGREDLLHPETRRDGSTRRCRRRPAKAIEAVTACRAGLSSSL